MLFVKGPLHCLFMVSIIVIIGRGRLGGMSVSPDVVYLWFFVLSWDFGPGLAIGGYLLSNSRLSELMSFSSYFHDNPSRFHLHTISNLYCTSYSAVSPMFHEFTTVFMMIHLQYLILLLLRSDLPQAQYIFDHHEPQFNKLSQFFLLHWQSHASVN